MLWTHNTLIVNDYSIIYNIIIVIYLAVNIGPHSSLVKYFPFIFTTW